MEIPALRSSPTRLTKLACALTLAFAASATTAAENPLTKINYDATKNANVLDLVMSIDWDFDNPPAGRDKTFIEAILKQSSQSLYTMTEGKQMLGKVYVYKNSQFIDNTDIQYLVKDGRANAHVAGISNCKSCRILMFAGTNEPAADHGKTIAHEIGHYALGIYDEYREVGGTSTNPGSPQDADTPKNTIMNDHLKYTNLSTATDYADPAAQKTAQFRTYNKSAWETLVSSPTSDLNGGPGRTQFDPFKNMTAPTAADLKYPTTGWESSLQVVYMGSNGASSGNAFSAASSGPINVIVVDTTVAKTQFDAQINAAIQVVNAAGDNSRIAVYAHPYSSAPVVPLTLLSLGNARSSVKSAIGKIAQDTSSDDLINGDRLFDWAESSLPSLFPGGVKSVSASGYYYRLYPGTNQGVGVKGGRVYYYDGKSISDIGTIGQWLPQARVSLSATLQKGLSTITGVRTDADTPMVTLFTTESQTVDGTLAKSFQDAKVAVNPVVLVTNKNAKNTQRRFTAAGVAEMSLYDLANGTHGQFQEATKPADLARGATKAANAAEGDNYEPVGDASADVLAANASSSTTSIIAGGGIDGEVTFQAFWSDEDDGSVSYALTAPNGTKITPTSLPAGVTYANNPGEGMASYTVSNTYAGHDGSWISTISATKATTDSVFQEIAVKSSLSAIVDIFGGVASDTRPMFATVEVSGPLPVKGASVVADVYSATTGSLVKPSVVFKDDGVIPDNKTGDGKYTASLADLPAGDYEIVARVSGDGTAVFTTTGATKKGTNQPDIVVPAFQRSATTSFKKEL